MSFIEPDNSNQVVRILDENPDVVFIFYRTIMWSM